MGRYIELSKDYYIQLFSKSIRHLITDEVYNCYAQSIALLNKDPEAISSKDKEILNKHLNWMEKRKETLENLNKNRRLTAMMLSRCGRERINDAVIKKDTFVILFKNQCLYLGSSISIQKRISNHFYNWTQWTIDTSNYQAHKFNACEFTEIKIYLIKKMSEIEATWIKKLNHIIKIRHMNNDHMATHSYKGKLYINEHDAFCGEYDQRGHLITKKEIRAGMVFAFSGKTNKKREVIAKKLIKKGLLRSWKPYGASVNLWILGKNGTIGLKKLFSIKPNDYVIQWDRPWFIKYIISKWQR